MRHEDFEAESAEVIKAANALKSPLLREIEDLHYEADNLAQEAGMLAHRAQHLFLLIARAGVAIPPEIEAEIREDRLRRTTPQ